MRLITKLIATTSLACVLSPAQAEVQLSMQHHIADAYVSGEQTHVTLNLQVLNQGQTSLHSARLYPAGNAFSPSLQAHHLSLGYLPAQGQTNVRWSLETPLAAEYFHAGMPLFFHLKGKRPDGETVVLPVYSHGEVY